MNKAQPIRNKEDLHNIRSYYQLVEPHPRNQLLIIMGLNTALRISDILSLRWCDVYDYKHDCWRDHINLYEAKTGKYSSIFSNSHVVEYLKIYKNHYEEFTKRTPNEASYIFTNGYQNVPLSRVQAYNIVRRAAIGCDLDGVVSCHSLRKTFGYHAWKQGTQPALLMNIYNHSSFEVTKRYLGIDQDDRDSVFRNVKL